MFDNGGQYISREFETYYFKYNIRHEKMSLTLQMMNHTIIEGQVHLKSTKISNVFYGIAAQTTCYLITNSHQFH